MLLILVLLTLFPFTKLKQATYCSRHPKAIQCMALRSQAAAPRKELCNPSIGECNLNDLIEYSYADCEKKALSDDHLTLKNDFGASPLLRCFPKVTSAKDAVRRVIAPSEGSPQCVPIHVSRLKSDQAFTCGEKGSRCVCDSKLPKGITNDFHLHVCRCQWFIDLCQIKNLCVDKTADCAMLGSSVTCNCKDGRQCNTGINQCVGNPSLCEDDNGVCIDLEESQKSWVLGQEKEGEGYACMDREIYDEIKKTTTYCEMTKAMISFLKAPRNDLDNCCYEHVVCAEGRKKQYGSIFGYRPCYCNVQFRKCLLRYVKDARYSKHAKAMIKILNYVKNCSVDDGQRCNPMNRLTCSTGDLIDSKIAHCKIDCKSGPLLPIEIRACFKRQCLPGVNAEGVRVIDVPDDRVSSVCMPVQGLPVECGMQNTRCVCDGQPTSEGFTDRCRCQYWPRYD